MSDIEEPARSVPVIEEADICVIGGSATGTFAAVRAARLGARVVLVEKQNSFGANVSGNNTHFDTFRWSMRRNFQQQPDYLPLLVFAKRVFDDNDEIDITYPRVETPHGIRTVEIHPDELISERALDRLRN